MSCDKLQACLTVMLKYYVSYKRWHWTPLKGYATKNGWEQWKNSFYMMIIVLQTVFTKKKIAQNEIC